MKPLRADVRRRAPPQAGLQDAPADAVAVALDEVYVKINGKIH
jgi:hypothetical protein